MQRCNLDEGIISRGAGCVTPGTFSKGCIYEIAWESLGLADGGTDATLKHLPRAGQQVVIDFHVDLAMVDWAATGAAGGMEICPSFLTAITINSRSLMPDHNSNSGAAITSDKYSLAGFAREVCQKAGGCMSSLASGEGTPWAQFGAHMVVLGIYDDITLTIANEAGQVADFGGTIVVLQLNTTSQRQPGMVLDS